MRTSSLFWLLAAACLFPFAQAHSAGSARLEFREGLFWVEANLSGYGTAKFLVDSGAGATLIDRRIAKALALPEGRAHRVQGVSGTVPAAWVNGITGTVAGASLPSSVIAVNLQGVAGLAGRVDGLLGMDFFEGRAVQIDFPRRVLRVLAAGESASVAGDSVPLTRRNGCLVARVSVNGEDASWMRVDTGCESAMEWVNKSAAGQTPGRRMRAHVKLGAVSVPEVSVGAHERPFFSGEGGLIGNGLLAKFCVTIDASRKQMVLTQ